MPRLWIVCVAIFAVGSLCGCSTKTPRATSEGADSQATDQATGDVADATGNKITVDSTPEEVCAHFIGLLRAGQTEQAERCLTQTAITQIRSNALELSPPGGPNADYRFRPAEFASAKQEVAFVPCVVVHEGQTEEFRMMLRRGERGWKVAGMLMQTEGASSDLLSFENPVDVARIKSMLGDDMPPVHEAAADSTVR